MSKWLLWRKRSLFRKRKKFHFPPLAQVYHRLPSGHAWGPCACWDAATQRAACPLSVEHIASDPAILLCPSLPAHILHFLLCSRGVNDRFYLFL
ncbi:uncharacterized [Tachysurus ichikawai]